MTTLRVPILSCIEEASASGEVRAKGFALTIRCYTYPIVTTSPPRCLSLNRKLAVEAMTLFMRTENEIRETRADWNEDRFRRLMRLRPKAVTRLQRRWKNLNPPPPIPLGSLRRRYHANIDGHLFSISQD